MSDKSGPRELSVRQHLRNVPLYAGPSELKELLDNALDPRQEFARAHGEALASQWGADQRRIEAMEYADTDEYGNPCCAMCGWLKGNGHFRGCAMGEQL